MKTKLTKLIKKKKKKEKKSLIVTEYIGENK